jgi:hypothetical protein
LEQQKVIENQNKEIAEIKAMLNILLKKTVVHRLKAAFSLTNCYGVK